MPEFTSHHAQNPNNQTNKIMTTITRLIGAALLIIITASQVSTPACTIFTITDTNRVLFCNNEDWKDPKTRIWFVPGSRQSGSGSNRYGCAYVGFGNKWGQGGLNTEGLAFDWVAGYQERWKRDSKMKMKSTKGNPAERMLETCATVEEAVAFFQSHWEPSFSYAKIMVADHTGASVIIGAANGQLDLKMAKQSRGFGYGDHIIDKMLAEAPAPTLTNAAHILLKAKQQGKYATKYSNVFDLKSGDIYLFRFPDQSEGIKLNLAEELKIGRHFYDIPEIGERLMQKSK